MLTALYLYRAQIWVSQHSWATLTPWSQLLTDKAAPSVLQCSGEIWHCSRKLSLHAAARLSFLLQVIPCDMSITCNYEVSSQMFYSEELEDRVD